MNQHKLFLDECIPNSVYKELQSPKVDVLTAHTQGFTGVSDDVIFRISQELQGTIVTLDRGIGAIERYPVETSYRVIIIRNEHIHPTMLPRMIVSFLNTVSFSEITGKLVIIAHNTIRIIKR